MEFTELTICNLAITRGGGGDRIDALDEESPLAAFCQETYATKRDYVLGKYRWTFANRVAPMAQLEVPASDPKPCAFKYARPADLAGAVHAWRETPDPQRSRIVPYVLESDGAFWSDQSPLFGEYTRHVPEAEWPSWFRELMITAYAADVADFCQLTTKARDLYQRAWGTPQDEGRGGLFADAMTLDARMAPQRQLVSGVDAGPLVEARAGWGLGRFGFTGFSLTGA